MSMKDLTYVGYLRPSVSRTNSKKSQVVASDVKALVKQIKETYGHSVTTLLIITEKPISKMGMSSDEVVPSLKIQKFTFDELYADPTNHIFSPKYTKLSKDQVAELIEKYKYKLDTFPKMETNDPVAKFLDYRVGDVLLVERDMIIPISYATKSISYRLVEQSKS